MNARTGATAGGAFGLFIAACFFLLTTVRASPGGEGENLMWFSTYATIWGLPLSLLINPLAMSLRGMANAFPALYVPLVVAIPMNWALIGCIVGWGANALRKRAPRARG